MKTEDDLVVAVASLRQASQAGKRAPHKPLLLLWALGQWSSTSRARFSFDELDEPVSALIDEFGPPGRERRRAYLPFFHLEDALWVKHDAPDRRRLSESGASAELHPDVVRLLEDDPTLVGRLAQRVIADNFTESYTEPIAAATGVPEFSRPEDASGQALARRRRRSALREEALVSYGYCCAMCGWDGRMARDPVAIEVAHVRWHAFDGPDVMSNVMALCSLHHRLFDLGVLGLGDDLQVRVSPRFNARSAIADTLVHALVGDVIRQPRSAADRLDPAQLAWHGSEVYKDHFAA